MKYVEEILEAMRATRIADGESGLWMIRSREVTSFQSEISSAAHPNRGVVAPRRYKFLERWTNDSIYKGAGELVMVDHDPELRTHLEFVMRASGNVLVTGLGLGCVIRGLLHIGRCDRITVVERSRDVIRLVWPYVVHDRVRLVYGDARDFVKNCREFDYAWHDLWSDPDRDEEHLAVTHQQLMIDLRNKCTAQGAWAFPRRYRRALKNLNVTQVF